MRCQAPNCKNPEQDRLYNVPGRQVDGALSAMTCRDCGVRLGIICDIHDFPHLGFDDGTTACAKCIQEIITESTVGFIMATKQTLQEKLPESAWDDLREEDYLAADDSFMLLHRIVTRAVRDKTTVDAIMEQIVKDGTFHLITAVDPLHLVR